MAYSIINKSYKCYPRFLRLSPLGPTLNLRKGGTSQRSLGLINELPSWEQTAPKAKN